MDKAKHTGGGSATVVDIQEILQRCPGRERDSLIPVLQTVQEAQGYLSREAILAVGAHLNLPASKIYGVATFYNQFRFEPSGRYHVQICRGTACHVKGSAAIQERLERDLKIKAGQTTLDGLFSLEVVACIGACGLAPVVSINGEFHAKVSPDAITALIRRYRKQANEEAA